MSLVETGGATVDSAAADAALERVAIATSAPSFIAFLAGDVEPLFHAIAQQNFDDEGTRDSGWDDLKDSTVARRELYGFPPAHPINHRTGDLESYVLEPGIIADEGKWATWLWPGASRDYALDKKYRTAQLGMKGTVPRPIVEVNEEDFATIQEALHDHVLTILEGGADE